MTPSSEICLFGRSSRKREAGRSGPENAIVSYVITISIPATFVIFSGGVSRAIERVVELTPA
jgi:hypothetical protein